jgi:signal transduction histidine kinase
MDHPKGLRDDSRRSTLEDVLATVVHEARGPLTIVQTAVRLLSELDTESESSPRDRAALLEMIERNTALAVLLMDRMTLAHDIEDGTVPLATQTVDLVRLVDESVADLRYTVLADRPVEFVTVAALGCDLDPTAAREIVFNLLANAAKYSAEGSPIAVTLRRDGDTARLVVRDHGVGVLPCDSERIFEKFAQGDGYSPGVGLGLFISRGLARAHGGDISVRPARGEGSEFSLELPALA